MSDSAYAAALKRLAQHLPPEKALSSYPGLPDFLCIGAAKAGTTWLDAALRNHPLIWLPAIKETCYFNSIHMSKLKEIEFEEHRNNQVQSTYAWLSGSENFPYRNHYLTSLQVLKNFEPSDAWYNRVLAPPTSHHVVGEICPQYSVLPRSGIRHVFSLNPSTKIIVIIRDQIEVALSHALMVCGDNVSNERLIKTIEENLFQIKMYADYADWLRRWQGSASNSQFLILGYRMLQTDPVAVLRKVSDFIGIPFNQAFFGDFETPKFESSKIGFDVRAVKIEIEHLIGDIVWSFADSYPDLYALSSGNRGVKNES